MSPFNAAICTTTYLERQKCYSPDKKILFKKQLFDLEVKGQGPMKVITVRGTPPYGHAPTYQISLTYLERQKCYGPEKKIYLQNNYLTLRSKIKAHEGHYGMRHTALWSCTHIPNKYYFRNNYLTLRSKVKVPRRSLRLRNTALWSCTHIPNTIDLSRKTKI
jgi:hypothetical protein